MNIQISICAIPFFILCNVLSAQWEPDHRLTTDDSISVTNINNAWCIANGSNNEVHVVWSDTRDGNSEIYYKRSPDNGLSWSDDTRLSFTNDSSFYPAVAVGGSVVHVIWIEDPYDIRYMRSLDYGATWLPDTILYMFVPPYNNACISAHDRFAAIAWADGANEIGYMSTQNSGLTWSDAAFLPGFDYPSIAVQDSELHVVRNNQPRYQLLYSKSTNCGAAWLPMDTISNGNDIRTPSIAVYDSIVHVVWRDYEGGWVTRYARSTDGGAMWSAGTTLGQGLYASVTRAGNDVHVIRSLYPSNYMAYMHSSDNGSTWAPDTILTYPQGVTFPYPSIDCTDSVVNIVWRDARDGNSEIYYKRNLLSTAVGEGMDGKRVTASWVNIDLVPSVGSNSFRIMLNKPLRGTKRIYVSLYDAAGFCVWQNSFSYDGSPVVIEDGVVSRLTSGIYFYRVTIDGFTLVKKVVIIR